MTDTATGTSPCCGGLFGVGRHPATVPPLTLGRDAVLHSGYGFLANDIPPQEPEASGNGVRSYTVEASVYCADPGYLCPNWATPLAGTTATAPVLTSDGATAVVGTDTGLVAAVDTATGALRWTAQLGSPVTDAPALAHGTLFVPTAGGDLVALAADGCGAPTCAPLWSAPTGSQITQQPAVAGDVVVTGSADGGLHAFATAGCPASPCPSPWSADSGSEVTGAPAIAAGRLYVGTADGRLLAYAL